MRTATLNPELINLYLEVLQKPVSQRFDMKALILDTVPAKRMLYQVYLSVNGFDGQQANETLASLSLAEVRFIRFLQGTLFTDDELNQIKQAYAAINTNAGIPERYRYRSPIQTKAFAYYGRKFGRQPVLSPETVENLYQDSND